MAVPTNSQQSKTNRKLISVAEEYSDVWDVLNDTKKYPNASRLVCEAVRFYLAYKDKVEIKGNSNSNMINTIRDIVKEELQKINLSEMSMTDVEDEPSENLEDDSSKKDTEQNVLPINVNTAVSNVMMAIQKFGENNWLKD